jgi:outer membrane protein OmpA-like peptidoglycan-associated protein
MPSLVLAALVPAFAVDIDSYDPTPSLMQGSGGLQVHAPDTGPAGDWYLGAEGVYAHAPLVRTTAAGIEGLVSDRFGTHLLGGYNFGRVRIDAHAPIYPLVSGTAIDPALGSFAMGDLQLGGSVEILGDPRIPFGIAVIPEVSLPTGDPAHFTGAGGVGGSVALAAGADISDVSFGSANFGATLAPDGDVGGFTLGSSLDWGFGLGLRVLEKVVVGGEIDGNITLAGGLGPYNKNPIEAHVYAGWAPKDGFRALVGGGTGVVSGIGAPDARVVVAVGWNEVAPWLRDSDDDGLIDKKDLCPREPEDDDGFEDTDGCPDPDNDKDGVPDDRDACANVPEDKDKFEDDDGCPEPDNDRDGVLDLVDSCPLVVGPVGLEGCPDRDGDLVPDKDDFCPDQRGSSTTGGCPDRDNDRVIDAKDRCPDEPKDPREDPKVSDGCPKRVVVTAERIEINEKIFFETNKSTILPESFGLLDDLAKTLVEHPELVLIEVAGHTDDVGDDKKNLALSQGRADAVVKYLVEHGVEAARLRGLGYGETRPIANNATPDGQGQNHRVEFLIVQRR